MEPHFGIFFLMKFYIFSPTKQFCITLFWYGMLNLIKCTKKKRKVKPNGKWNTYQYSKGLNWERNGMQDCKRGANKETGFLFVL